MNKQALIDRLLDCYPRWSPTMYKLTLGAFVVLAITVPLGLVALPFVEFFNGMAAQPKGKAQATYGRTYGGEALVEREAVEGTVARSNYPYPYEHLEGTIEAAVEVGTHLKNPLPVTLANLQRGQRLYNVYCVACHGSEGQGNGPVIGPNRFPAPPSLHTKQAVGYEDGTIYHIMTKGLGKMPAYSDKLDSEERWMVAHYLRALQRSMAPKPEDLNP